MSLTDAIAWAPDHAAASPAVALPGHTPGDPLGVLIEHLRAHPRVDAAVFLVADPQRGVIEPAAQWFSSPLLREALQGALDRPYDRAQPGLTEAALERDRPLFLPRLDAWESATALHTQIQSAVSSESASRAWDALRGASVIACPVRTTLGRPMGVLIVASTHAGRALRRSDLETVSVLADLAALGRERSDMLVAEAARAREELLLKRAAEGIAGSLETGQVEQETVDHALQLVAADHARLTAAAPRSNRLTVAAIAGVADPPEEAGLDASTLAEVVRSRSRAHVEGTVHAIHAPVQLGPRLFGVLSLVRLDGARFTGREVELIEAVARISAAAMANALDFERERRVARALTRGFVPASPPKMEGFEMGFLYEPADKQSVGGDLYGSWRLPGGEVAVLVGDVAGKGVQTAAFSAMARFFIEARSWDCTDAAQALSEAGTLLADRLPSEVFVTASLGLLGRDGCLRYANAGHLRPLVLRAGGELGEAPGAGLPLGVSSTPSYENHALRLEPGDLVLGFTDGLVEARRQGELLGDVRLQAIVRAAGDRAGDVQELVRSVHHDVRDWAGGLSDDVVLLGLRRQVN